VHPQIGDVAQAELELRRRDPLGEEVDGHLCIAHVAESDIAGRNTLHEDVVAPKEVL